jgi:nucleoside-diphosphate-sugar epimerase
MAKKVLVLGSGGFIGGAMVKRQMSMGAYVVGVDIKNHEFGIAPNLFINADLSEFNTIWEILKSEGDSFDEIYQFAADMGGAGYIFTGLNDSNVMLNSTSINLNFIRAFLALKKSLNRTPKFKVFYSSSACIYPKEQQEDSARPNCKEEFAYPANPDSEYGWEKLYSERLFSAASRNHGLKIRIARFHNVFGPRGTYIGGKEKAPAAICRKVATASENSMIEIWGDGTQTRSFLYIDDCIDAVNAFMNSNFQGPVNIGSEEMVTINQLAKLTIAISGKNLKIKNIPGPIGVNGRNSQNDLFRKEVDFKYRYTLEEGIRKTYDWVHEQTIRTKSNV